MRGINLVIFGGNLGNDPDVRHMQTGGQVTSFSVAVSEKWKGKDGDSKEHTEWVRVVAYSATAETCGKYLAKGDEVIVIGRQRTREYEDRDGVNRKVTEVIADRVHFLSKKR
ncbi:MAG: single-stranded DNA-binding protein, partial [Deltaproteobacteria bacterium]